MSSNQRRDGRQAFVPGENPLDYVPYAKNSWGYNQQEDNFVNGWNEEKRVYDQQKLEEEQRQDNWDAESATCPWNEDDCCTGYKMKECTKENCAPRHFRKKAY